jgi:hypothetical protein
VSAAVPGPRFRDQLAEALERSPLAQFVADATDIADALLPLIAAEVEARVQAAANQRAAEALRPFEELFANPDTSCRTTWRREPGWSLPGATEPLTECVEVPMDDLRNAFDRAAALTRPAPGGGDTDQPESAACRWHERRCATPTALCLIDCPTGPARSAAAVACGSDRCALRGCQATGPNPLCGGSPGSGVPGPAASG